MPVSTAAPPKWPAPKEPFIDTPLQIGKYLVSPLTRAVGAGRYSAAVSIRSGRGGMTHDRVLRFVPQFDSTDAAARFATAQALAWIDPPADAGTSPSFGLHVRRLLARTRDSWGISST